MSVEENKAIVRRHITEVLEQGHVELIDSYYPPEGPEPDKQSAQSWRDTVLWHHKNAPGFKATILNMIAEGDEVAVYVQIDITYLAKADNTPVGKPVTWRNMEMMRIVNGKLVSKESVWGENDMLVKEGVLVPKKSVST